MSAHDTTFRMALLSGEVETRQAQAQSHSCADQFRMALLSGEVETGSLLLPVRRGRRSGWLCYPGKLKHIEPAFWITEQPH